MKKLSILLLGSLLTTSCIHHESAPAIQKFAFHENLSTTAQKTDCNTVTRLLPAEIAPEFSSLGFVYRTNDTQYETDPYLQFINSPELLITKYIDNSLSTSSDTKIIDAQSLEQNNQVLSLKITKLYADYRYKSQPQAVTEIEATLYQFKDGVSKEMKREVFSESAEISANDPESLIGGYEANLGNITENISELLDA